MGKKNVHAFMRSGRYSLSSVLLHRGSAAQDGHFISICSLGSGVYVQCDDHELRDLTWSEVAIQSTWHDAYVLLYSRRAGVSAGPGRDADLGTSRTPSSLSRGPLPGEAVVADFSPLPQFPRMSEEASANARCLKARAAEARRDRARMRGIGNLNGTRKTATSQLARNVVAAMQRQRASLDSRELALQGLRDQYGAPLVDGFLGDMGAAAACVDLTVLECVLAADLAHRLEFDVAEQLSRPDNRISGPTRWQNLLDCLPDVLREGLLIVLHAEYKDKCSAILTNEWSWNWIGWDSRQQDGYICPEDGHGLFQVLESDRQLAEGELSDPRLLALQATVRHHMRLAHHHADVRYPSDDEKVDKLRRDGFHVGVGQTWGSNNCLPDSLLQLMQAHNVITRCDELVREAACAALREELNQLPENSQLRPMRRDPLNSRPLCLDDKAFLQTDVHGEYILNFFLSYFGRLGMLIGSLPPAGVRIHECSRFESVALPIATTDVCQAPVAHGHEELLHFWLFNRTGDSIAGYHYDPMTVIPAARILD